MNAENAPLAIALGGSKGAWTLYDSMNKVYLALTVDKNQLNSVAELSKNALWDIAVTADGEATITSVAYNKRTIRYNASSPRFSTYTQGQSAVELYAQATATDIQFVEQQANGNIMVYDVNGRFVRIATTIADALKHLPKGIYVVNGKKMLIK